MRKQLIPSLSLAAALLAAGPALAVESYVDMGVRSLTGPGAQVSVAAGIDGDLGNSGLRAGLEVGVTAGDTTYSHGALVLGYDGRTLSPYIKAGRLMGGVDADYRALGVEYRSGYRSYGWAAVVEVGRVAGSESAVGLMARYRF